MSLVDADVAIPITVALALNVLTGGASPDGGVAQGGDGTTTTA